MNEVMQEKLKSKIGKNLVIYTKKGFRFTGTLKWFSEPEADGAAFIEINEDKRNSERILNINDISEIEFPKD